MESEDIYKLCRLCGTCSEKMVDVLNCVKKESNETSQPNILEIIHNCLPVQISSYDGLPKIVCESCVNKSQAVYEFIQLILATQKMFLKNLDTVELIKSNKSKVVEKFAFDPQQVDKSTDFR